VDEGNSYWEYEREYERESSILDLMNSFISNSYLNQIIIDKQSIKGKLSLSFSLLV
jgi:hypothetical protein